jgi:UDP-2,3-diacylglucosamine pyrophosphatase LpxH
MISVVTGDVHLGSQFCHDEAFLAWMEALPQGASLILNGDVLDDPDQPLPARHHVALERLVELSFEREVVWVLGNHDDTVHLAEPGRIRFVRHWVIAQRALVIHGDGFDEVMPRHRWFIRVFRFLHRMRQQLGAHPIHVAEYAKKWKPLYQVLTQNVMENAVATAKEGGFEAVICGHTHYGIDVLHDGIRYLNTGAWTEEPFFWVCVQREDIEMKRAFLRLGRLPDDLSKA